MSEQVVLEAVKRPPGYDGGTKHWYRYNVYWQGKKIVSLSMDPEPAAARALRALGVEGTVAVVDSQTGRTRSLLNTRTASHLCTEENGKTGPRFRKHIPWGERA